MATLGGCRTALALLAAGIVALGTGSAALAHPHVWIEARTDAVFDAEGRLEAVNVEWKFDEFYSTTAVEGLDKDGNGTYEPEELLPLARENLVSLREYRFFTQVKAGGKAVDYADVTEYGSFFKDGQLNLYFTLPMAKPVDPTTSQIEYSLYDPTFYIAVELAAKDPVELLGSPPAVCKAAVLGSVADSDANNSEEFYAKLSAADDIGALSAQRIEIGCPRKTAAQ
jgi:ABC-type uncharacterized transport system substrate-binding protein